MKKVKITKKLMKDLMTIPEGMSKSQHFKNIAKKYNFGSVGTVSHHYYKNFQFQGNATERSNTSEEAKSAAAKVLDEIVAKTTPTKPIKMNGSTFEFPDNSFMVGSMKITW